MAYFKNLLLGTLLATSLANGADFAGNNKFNTEIKNNLFHKITKSEESEKIGYPNLFKTREFQIPSTLERIGLENIVSEQIDWKYVAGILSGTGALMYTINSDITSKPWWDYRKDFHFEIDDTYQGSVDKLGHAFSFNLLSNLYYVGFKNAHFSDMESRWLAFGSAASMQLFTESYDGRGPTFGFDIKDVIAGVTGAGLTLLQGYMPLLENIKLKWSFKPRASPPYDDLNPMIKDVENQKYWLSVNIWKGFGLAVGVNRSDFRNSQGFTRFYLSPEFDITTLDPDSDILRLLSSIKLPTIMIRLNDGKIFGNPYNNN
jgi:hypothetical protein